MITPEGVRAVLAKSQNTGKLGRPAGNGKHEKAFLEFCRQAGVPLSASAFAALQRTFLGRDTSGTAMHVQLTSLWRRGAVVKLRCRDTGTIKWWHRDAGELDFGETFDEVKP